jgi:hypothetical protein
VGAAAVVVELPPPDELVVGGVMGARLLTLLLGDGVTTGSRLLPWGIVVCATGVATVLFVGAGLVVGVGGTVGASVVLALGW